MTYLYANSTVDKYYGKNLNLLIRQALKEWKTYNGENVIIIRNGMEIDDKQFKDKDWLRAIVVDDEYYKRTKEFYVFVNNILRKRKESARCTK